MGVEDIPELIQHIQSRLPVKDAARTTILSKSWLYAWSTVPTLRFDLRTENSIKSVEVDRTLIRYLHNNIPIERFNLMIDTDNNKSGSHALKWIKPITTKTSLKEISLNIFLSGVSFTFPDEILANENLTKITIRGSRWIRMTSPVINCVSLRELDLEGSMSISEDLLNNILSSCSLLVKVVLLCCCKGFNTIKLKNLSRLHEFQIALEPIQSTTAFEISHVPNLRVFSCYLDLPYWRHAHSPVPFNNFSTSLGGSVTTLMLGGVITDNACLEILETQFPFLESLTLELTLWTSGTFRFTCASIKRLSLLMCPRMLIDVHIHAPKLIFFKFGGITLPSLLFPVSSLKLIDLSFSLDLPEHVDANFFLKIRETLTLAHYCNLHITVDNSKLPLDNYIDIDALRTRRVFPPARNVQQLWFETRGDECVWDRSVFFDALFEIFRPKHVLAFPDRLLSHSNHFCRLMLTEVLDKKNKTYWCHHLKHVQIRMNSYEEWETLTNSHRSFLDGSGPVVYPEFKLNWC